MRERLTLGLLLASIFAIRAIHPDQPIVENYVGRQIPTAMVARNLERGNGFLFPQLDTGPFPNLFLVEPPIYAQLVVSVRSAVGFDLEPTGRWVSAVAVVLGGWGLFGLVRRREGLTVALVALASFGIFPVMIRYGRAFQPDALMVGCLLAGLRGWDEWENGGSWRWAVFGGFVLGIGLALKITVAWALIPFVLIPKRWSIGWRLGVASLMLVPAGLWYLHVWQDFATSGAKGSLASSDNASLWLQALSPEAWLRFVTYENLGRGLVGSFTPVGFVLAIYGLLGSGKLDRLWVGWALGALLSIVGLASKWHHAYYWMVVAPLAAVGIARGLVHLGQLERFGRPASIGLGSFLLVMCVVQSASTFKTPEDWESLNEATRQIHALSGHWNVVVASEAVLYYADVRGCRLEFNPLAMKRAAGEFGYLMTDTSDPLALVEFYRDLLQTEFPLDKGSTVEEIHQAARNRQNRQTLLVADVGLTDHEPRRRAWRELIRRRPQTTILADQPGYLIAELR
jgi:4-amino-4-deoxy-L-arabinose transferase-like glycosyltransferase